MEVKPGYKQTEVGLIPEDWDVTTVGDEFSIQLGKMLDSEKNAGVPKPYLGNRAIQWGRIDLSDIGSIKLTPSDLQRYRLRKGDLLVCEGGEIGRAAIWCQPLEECYYQKALHRLRPTRGYSVKLLLNILQRLAASGFLLNFVTQTSIAHLPKDKFETVPIPRPRTKAEQEAIAEALSDADAHMESLEQLIVKKRDIKQGAMQELLTGRKRLPGFTENWELRNISEVCWFQEGPGVRNTQFTVSGIKLLNGTNIYCGALNLEMTNRFISEKEAYGPYAHFLAKSGDIVIASSGIAIDRFHEKVAFVRESDLPLCMNTSTIRFQPFTAALLPTYLFQFLTSDAFKWMIGGQATGSAQLNFGPSHVRKISLSLPPLPEQFAVAMILCDMDAEIAALEAKVLKARQLKQGTMQELLTGRLRLL
jgi:type I restriction enzyme S subunit